MKVIYDCDNTMGLEFRDIDDGLALMYLYKNQRVDLLGVTLTFGNDDIDRVIKSTQTLKEKFKLDIDIYNGVAVKKDYKINKAAHFIVEQTKKFPGEITLLATGALKNVADAYLLDNGIFKRLKDIVIMGGITEPLVINNKVMNELNMTVDNESSYITLKNSIKPTVLTGNACLNSKLYISEITEIINSLKENSEELYEECSQWIKFHSEDYGVDYIIVWDLLAAVYVTNPEIFIANEYIVEVDVDLLKTGFMKKTETGNQKINIPKLINKSEYIKIVKESYLK